jgi:spermidine synthase
VRFGFLEGGLVLIFVLCVLRARPVSLAIFSVGTAASALEIVLLLGFQILYGSVYHQVGLIVTMFMIGLGIGSFTMNRQLSRRKLRDLIWLEGAVAVYAALLPWALLALARIPSATVQAVISRTVMPLLALVLAAFVGLAFPLAGKADFRGVADTAARLYTADYLGAALGALLVSTWLIPVLGVVTVCQACAGLNLLSAAVLLVSCGRSPRACR